MYETMQKDQTVLARQPRQMPELLARELGALYTKLSFSDGAPELGASELSLF
jgi:hypothetical protein